MALFLVVDIFRNSQVLTNLTQLPIYLCTPNMASSEGPYMPMLTV
jgi:hypothetical protein